MRGAACLNHGAQTLHMQSGSAGHCSVIMRGLSPRAMIEADLNTTKTTVILPVRPSES
jgi:hypothetical protein